MSANRDRSSSIVSPLFSPLPSNEESDAPQVVIPNGIMVHPPELQIFQTHPHSAASVQSHSARNEEDRQANPLRPSWRGLIPPRGSIRWFYTIVFLAMLATLIALIVVIVQRSKPFFNRLFGTIKMPSTTIVVDPYNTTGRYMTYRGQDHTGNDIVGTITYSIEQCIAACDSFNKFVVGGQGPQSPCLAGTMNYNQAGSVDGQNANCFLKTKAGEIIDDSNEMALGFKLCLNDKCTFNSTG